MMTPAPFSSARLARVPWLTAAVLSCVLLGGLPCALTAAEPAPSRAGLEFFEKKIRPVLADKCIQCHTDAGRKRKGGLALDSREAILRGGDSGPAVVVGNPDDSLLVQVVRYTSDQQMPPKDAGGKLSDSVIRDFEQWVKMGLPDPRLAEKGTTPVKQPKKTYDPEAAKAWWSFQPVQKPTVPSVETADWAKGNLDKFVLAGLEAKGLKPSRDADAGTLLRRVHYDLTGLPPTPAELEAFLPAAAKDMDAALAAVVDKLLASPEFGQRWGRHWLDVARYSESTGKDSNIAFPHAWRYRDYVVDSFNRDKPFDQFVREQLAGDLLPTYNDKQKAENLVATGFLAMGAISLNEMNPRQLAVDVADEQIDTFSQAILGVTIACARCHDHKFDPISQKEYTALAGIFLSTETKYGTAGTLGGRNAGTLIELPEGAKATVVAKALSAAERKSKEDRLAKLEEELRDAYGGAAGKDAKRKAAENGLNILRLVTQLASLRTELAGYNEDGTPKSLAMGVSDKAASAGGGGGFRPFAKRPGQPGQPMPGQPMPGQPMPGGFGRFRRPTGFESIGDAPLFERGEIDKAGAKVARGFPAALTHGTPPTIAKNTSGRRELAEWVTAPGNPLTARVMANRVWHWLMGRGIVASNDNFGTTGDKPANQPLLDYLAADFVESGWSVKKLVRQVVLSHTYRQATVLEPKAVAADPDNALFGRAEVRRLDAECLRDGMLAAAGLLDHRAQPGSLVAKAGDGPVGGARFFSVSEDAISKADGNFRSMYLPITRGVLPDALEAFDFPDPSMVAGARETTNVPAQALFLLNHDFTERVSRSLAAQLIKEFPSRLTGKAAADDVEAQATARITAAYKRILNRAPERDEITAAVSFLRRFKAVAGQKKSVTRSDAASDAWTSLCRALFSSAEFRYVR